MKSSAILLPLVFALAGLSSSLAQTAAAPASDAASAALAAKSPVPPKPSGELDIIVNGDDGKPLVDARVVVSRVGELRGGRMSSTDEAGHLHVANLSPGMYRIMADAPALVEFRSDGSGPDGPRYYRPGETVNIQLVPGGVITGTATDREGNPMVGLTVNVVRIHEAGDNDNDLVGSLFRRGSETDDRGVYRIYGLPAGKYLVYAGGQTNFNPRQTPYDKDAPTYFPSSTRDTASTVNVIAGQEYSGIDIRYRNEPGFQVSGTITGNAGKNVQLVLTVPGNPAPMAFTSALEVDGRRAFVFTGVATGTYKLSAGGSDEPLKVATSGSLNVRVQGSDVSGLELKLTPMAALSGKVVLDSGTGTKCSSASPTLDSVAFNLKSEKKNDDDIFKIVSRQNEIGTNARGEFQTSGLTAGRYRLQTILPSDHWYLRSVSKPKSAPAGGAQRNGPPTSTLDPFPESISLISGETMAGIAVTVGTDGGVISGTATVADGSPASAGLRFYLVPAEKERADDALRYFEAKPNRDGTYAFKNLAPGKYYLASRVANDSTPSVRTLAGDAKERSKLLQDAAAQVSLEVKPCQVMHDHKLSIGPDGSIKP